MNLEFRLTPYDTIRAWMHIDNKIMPHSCKAFELLQMLSTFDGYDIKQKNDNKTTTYSWELHISLAEYIKYKFHNHKIEF